MDPFVSIVTPVYNGESYIEECIKSVLSQNYSNWEYIIVNNKSEDGTLAIAQKYAALDSRIKVISNKYLLPVMENFNNSIRKISPKSTYCKIICADDWIYPEFLTQTVELAEQNPNVGIVSSYWLVGGKVLPEGMPYRQKIFSGCEMSRMNLLKRPYTFGTPSVLLYRSELVLSKDRFFGEERTSGDTEACYEVLKDWDFAFVPQLLSFQRQHKKTVTSSAEFRGDHVLNPLYAQKIYGESLFDKSEAECREKELLSLYYKFLGTHPGRLKDKQFVNYHIKSLEKIGLDFNWKKVLWYFFLEGTKYVLLKFPRKILRSAVIAV